jgi:hypothetical protein
MGKVSAVFAGSVISLFVFFWYQAYIPTDCVSSFLCNGFGSQADKARRINISEANSGGVTQNGHVEISDTPLRKGTDTRNVDTNSAGILKKPIGIMGQNETVPRDTADITGGGLEMERTDNTNLKVPEESRQRLNVTQGASRVGSANSTKINSLETEPTPGDRHIIFIETGCLLDGSVGSEYLGLSLHKRQACVIESAAKMNPEYKVYLLYSCQINGKLEYSSEHVRQIFAYPNVKLWRLDMTKYFLKTPLEKWNFVAAMASSAWPKEHSSDVLRLLTLWKYGGTYLDLDVVILK